MHSRSGKKSGVQKTIKSAILAGFLCRQNILYGRDHIGLTSISLVSLSATRISLLMSTYFIYASGCYWHLPGPLSKATNGSKAPAATVVKKTGWTNFKCV